MDERGPTYMELLDYFVNHASDIDSDIRDQAIVAFKRARVGNFITSWYSLPYPDDTSDMRTHFWLEVLRELGNAAISKPMCRFEDSNHLVYREYMLFLLNRNNRSNSGAIPESSGNIQEDEMTESRPWPNNMIVYRNEAAASLAIASEKLQRFIVDEDNADVIVMQALIEVNNALRFLERAGAPTMPPQRGV